ncbi:hypothetical protein A2706_01690 [Candidatus Peribacteria bacterium RIFCSPHIGHO2_01_FULL_51_35]|nr:MAG: hypothetical protein A2706_01690 [Candidatus Peribacteria bacterium RIFCSPHIGHO2_01_FULL_51_35]
MANRDIGISICGVVVGVLIGAGSVLYTQDPAVGSLTDVAYRGWETRHDRVNARAFNARNIEKSQQEQTLHLKNAPRLERKAAEQENVHTAAPVQSADCDVAQYVSDQVTPFVPKEQSQVYGNIRKSLADAVATFCN